MNVKRPPTLPASYSTLRGWQRFKHFEQLWNARKTTDMTILLGTDDKTNRTLFFRKDCHFQILKVRFSCLFVVHWDLETFLLNSTAIWANRFIVSFEWTIFSCNWRICILYAAVLHKEENKHWTCVKRMKASAQKQHQLLFKSPKIANIQRFND